MVSFTVRLSFEEGDRDAIAEMLRALARASREEAGCVTYIPHFVKSEPMTVLIYEQYLDEAALEHHRNTAHFQRYAANGFYQLKHTRQLEWLEAIGQES